MFAQLVTSDGVSYLRLCEGEVAYTRAVEDGLVYADHAADGTLLGIEILAEVVCSSQ